MSLSAENKLLAQRESVLRSAGYQVLSTISEAEVRFEIQMGQCGVLLLCYTIHQVKALIRSTARVPKFPSANIYFCSDLRAELKLF